LVVDVYFPRRIDQLLADWAESSDRKPLVLRGARQTGKSSAVRELGLRFALFLELNLELRADRALVRGCTSAADLLEALRVRHEVATRPERTLLFLDEIQESPEAIRWLREFRERHPRLAVVAAGSLMEVRLRDRGFSFPVGRVTFRTVRPFTFLEFARALGRRVLVETLEHSVTTGVGVPAAVHEDVLRLLRDYVVVGGMPEAVATWAQSSDLAGVARVHADLLQAFAEDLPRYGGRDATCLEDVFESLPRHYGRRFAYTKFAAGHGPAAVKRALGKLEGAMLVSLVWPTASLTSPLQVKTRRRQSCCPSMWAWVCGQRAHRPSARAPCASSGCWTAGSPRCSWASSSWPVSTILAPS
jgi:predicted AAA+ superfamily ATPase